MRSLLRDEYAARSVWLVPLPGAASRVEPKTPIRDELTVAMIGYWAPYKGLDIFLDAAERVGPRAQFILGGLPHQVLTQDSEFRDRVAAWRKRADLLKVSMPGFMSAEQLDSSLSGRVIGLLPYTSVSGASASFRLYAERAVPVIASDLAEFRYLEESGAGVLLTTPSGAGMADAIERLENDPTLWLSLAQKQVEFTRENSWENFLDGLLGMNRNPPRIQSH
jgi:glycosyltransferase involved in cell wall biosynthesis